MELTWFYFTPASWDIDSIYIQSKSGQAKMIGEHYYFISTAMLNTPLFIDPQGDIVAVEVFISAYGPHIISNSVSFGNAEDPAVLAPFPNQSIARPHDWPSYSFSFYDPIVLSLDNSPTL